MSDQSNSGVPNERGSTSRDVSMALIGCGAVAERCHLPAASSSQGVTITTLVEKNVSRAKLLANRFGIPKVADDFKDIIDDVEAAVVALPHALHAPVTLELLERGIHVLVEKPMALSTEDCREMVAAARRAGVVLAVGLVRRFYPAMQTIRKAVENQVIGQVRGFDFREGRPFDWPVASDSLFRKDTAGGGVLIDIGVHVLDLLQWWLGDCAVVGYFDDAVGGVEADCEVRLAADQGASGTVELSRTRQLRNSCTLRGSRGTLTAGTSYDAIVELKSEEDGSNTAVGSTSIGRSRQSHLWAFQRQLENFAGAIRGREPALVPGTEGMGSVQLFEACYALRQPLALPWTSWPPAVT